MRFRSNGRRLWLLLTLRLEDLRALAKAKWTRLQRSPLFVMLGFVLMLFGLATLLSACGTLSTPPTEPARNPQPPQLSEPLPSESYLQKAQKLIESWRNAVTGM
jgi:hypothetical protein